MQHVVSRNDRIGARAGDLVRRAIRSWRHGLRAFALLAIVSPLLHCTAGAPTAPISFAPQAGGPVWPKPPELPRYALARVLIGERDFLAPEDPGADTLESTLNWIAGIVVGEPEHVELRRPIDGMTDQRGWIYVVDAGHKAVMVFDTTELKIHRWNNAARGEPFSSPVGIAADVAGGIMVTDSERREVFVLSSDGTPRARFGKGILLRPTGIARDPDTGLIFVADTAAHDIKVFRDDLVLIDTIGGRGQTPGLFNAPTYLTFHDGRLYVADTLNFRIQVFDRDTEQKLAFGRLGLFVGDMARPKGVAIGEGGRIYVVESYYDHLLVYDGDGNLLLPIGGTGPAVGQFFLPSGVWTDGAGRVYVADMFNGRVVVFQELTNVVES